MINSNSNPFIETVECEVDGFTLVFRVAGMTEFYDAIQDINNHSANNDDVKELQDKVDQLNKVENRTEEQNHELSKLSARLSDRYITGDKRMRKFLIDHVIEIKKDDRISTIEEARWFIDRRDSVTLSELLNKVRPDLEKNSPSQS